MGYLESLGFEVLERRVKKYARTLVTEIKQHITDELEKHMATLDEALTQLETDIKTELQQVADAIGTLASAQAENSDLKAQLEALQTQTTAAADRVSGLSTQLQADDPAPADPTV